MKENAIFLDRDGTVCREVNYLSRPEDLELFPFSAEAIRIFNKNFRVIIITNQSGISRGYFNEKALSKINDKLLLELEKDGAKIDGVYFCPHLAENFCDCRKPKTGMLDRAVQELNIDLKKSWMIGDKISDIETGFNTGTQTALVLTGYGQKELAELERQPDLVEVNILEVARKISGK